MKRLIKFYNKYNSDKAQFSNCSTEYEVLPHIVQDDATPSDLRELAKSLNYNVKHQKVIKNEPKRWGGIEITEAIFVNETKTKESFNNKETFKVYLGFATIPDEIEVKESLNNPVSQDMLTDLINSQVCEMYTIAEIDRNSMLVISGWDAFHLFQLAGYTDFDTTLRELDIYNSVFDDSVFSCHDCGEWEYNDNGYVNNFRIVNECSLLGINCGCYEKHCIDNVESFIGDHTSVLDDSAIYSLLESNKIELLETFISGMVDERGGYINGKSVSESTPEEAKEKYKEHDVVFGLDDSGQFQTYFSIYKIAA